MLPKLYHYSAKPFEGGLESRSQLDNDRGNPADKPHGFWVSCCEDTDDDGETAGWWDYCKTEEWGFERLIFRHSVVLRGGARILHLKSRQDILDFTDRYFSNAEYKRREGADAKRFGLHMGC